MDTFTFNQYYKALEVIQAREYLMQLKAADFPKLSKDQREKLFREFYRKANPRELRNEKVLTTAELARKVGASGQ